MLTNFISLTIKYATIMLLLVNVKAFAFTMSQNFTQESELPHKYANQIKTFWSKGNFSHFNGVANKRINYATFTHEAMMKSVVIVPGRSESYLKYQELIFDLYNQGFDVFILDHRGQGLSQRLTENTHKGYIKHFDDYAEDLHTFIENHVTSHDKTTESEKSKTTPYLLAHSMGGTIALRMMQRYPSSIKSAVLASPMIAINSGEFPNQLARAFIKTGTTLNNTLPSKPWYFIGQKDYHPTAFNDNDLTSSVVRYQNFLSVYEASPEIQLGGVTFQWLTEAFRAQELIFKEIDKLITPINILQASEDTVVDNTIQNEFCRKLHQHNKNSCPNAAPTVIQGAKHELFNEKDHYRKQALTFLLAWFEKTP